MGSQELYKLDFVEKCRLMVRIVKGEIVFADNANESIDDNQISLEGKYSSDK